MRAEACRIGGRVIPNREIVMRVFLLAGSLLAACASSTSTGPPPVEIHSTSVAGQAAAARSGKISKTVQAVDKETRTLTLKGADGTIETIYVPSQVQRFDDVAAGDTITVETQEGLLLEYQPAGSPDVKPTAVVDGARATDGPSPSAAAAATVRSSVTITGIDTGTRIVEFQNLDGDKYHVKAGPEIAIEKLAVGDRLIATYGRAVAITLEK
jgi:hypothetical protein